MLDAWFATARRPRRGRRDRRAGRPTRVGSAPCRPRHRPPDLADPQDGADAAAGAEVLGGGRPGRRAASTRSGAGAWAGPVTVAAVVPRAGAPARCPRLEAAHARRARGRGRGGAQLGARRRRRPRVVRGVRRARHDRGAARRRPCARSRSSTTRATCPTASCSTATTTTCGCRARVTTVIKGDATCLAVAAASCVAKVTRDAHDARGGRALPAVRLRVERGLPRAGRTRPRSRGYGPSAIHRRSWIFMERSLLARASRRHPGGCSSSVEASPESEEAHGRRPSRGARPCARRTHGVRWPASATTSGTIVSDCEDWTVRELVNHVVTGQLLGGRARRRARPSRRWATGSTATCSATTRSRAYDDSAAGGRGGVPRAGRDGRAVRGVVRARCRASVYCGHRFIDVLVHGWDVATSTGSGHHARSRAGRGVLGGGRAAARHARRPAARSAPTLEVARRRRRPDPAARDARPSGSEPPDAVVLVRMGQFITVTVRPGASPSVRIFDLNRSLTGMAIERYRVGGRREGRRPPPTGRAREAAVRPRRHDGDGVLELGGGARRRPSGGRSSSPR